MKISVIDASNYFKGLLLLITRDRILNENEKELLMRIGKTLGFEREFCETTISQVLENKYIIDELPVFSTRDIARSFIIDGLAMAYSDNEVHPLEEKWLKEVSDKYDIDFAWFHIERIKASSRKGMPAKLEADEMALN